MKTILEQSYVYQLSRVPAKGARPYPPTEIIPGTCKVYDSSKGQERTAIYLTGQKTIWADEIDALKNQLNPRGRNIIFTNGYKLVSSKERNLHDYLNVCGYNEANNESRMDSPILFRLIDNTKKAETVFDEQKMLDQARYFTSNEDIKTVRAYTIALTKNAADIQRVQGLSEYEIRLYARQLAEKNPQFFIEGMREQSLERKVNVIKAIYSDILIHDEADRMLIWKGGDMLIKAPLGLEPIMYFAEQSIDNKKYTEAYNNMMDMLNNKSKVKAKQVVKEEIEEDDDDEVIVSNVVTPNQDDVNEIDFDETIKKMFDSNILRKNGTWIVWEHKKWKSRAAFIKDIKGDAKLLERIKEIAVIK